MWHGSLFKQLPNTQRIGLPFPTHMQKIKTKRTIKIINPKNNIEKTKKEKIEVNKIFKNYRKKKHQKQEKKKEKLDKHKF